MRESDTATTNTPLPPSVEKAYHKKCIDLKKRLREVEAANDSSRLRKHRIDRSITKMRLERALLLEKLAKVQKRELKDVPGILEESESESPPATPQERHPRPRNRRQSPPPLESGYPTLNGSPPPLRSHRSNHSPSSRLYPAHPSNSSNVIAPNGPISHPSAIPSGYPPHPPVHIAAGPGFKDKPPPGHIDRRAPSEIPPHESLPLINNLPNGTNVVIIDGRPKQPPWNIKDVEPRHHLVADFEHMPLERQLNAVQVQQYCPYDIHGLPVVLGEERDEMGQLVRLRHVFKGDEGWRDPVTDNVRTDDPRERDRQQRMRREAEMARTTSQDDVHASRRRSASGMARERRRESGSLRERDRESASAPGSAHGKREGGGGFTAVNH
ncbi:MAG: hypothetical protein Q9162_000043 [Coniocarpon cinnabarinum]